MSDFVYEEGITYRIVLLVSGCALTVLVLLLFFGSYQKSYSCEGYLDNKTGVVDLSSPEEGLVEIVNIKEHSKVNKGQIIFRINKEKSTYYGSASERQIGILRQQIGLMQAELQKNEQDARIKILGARNKRGALISKKEYLYIEENLHLVRMRNSFQILEKEDSSYRSGYITESQYQNILQSYFEQRLSVVESLKSISETQNEINDVDNSIKSEEIQISLKRNEVRQKVLDLNKQIEREVVESEIFIRSPVDGIISAMQCRDHSRVANAQVLASIIPYSNDVEADVYADSSSIGYIRVGMSARLRYSAYPYLHFGSFKGVVDEVTETPISTSNKVIEQQLNGISDGVKKYGSSSDVYRVRIKIEHNFIKHGEKIYPLLSGMRVHSDLYGESKRLYKWIYFPFSDNSQ